MQFGSNIWIAPSQSRELINSLVSTVGDLAEAYVPTAFVSGAVIGATLCAACSPDGSPTGAPPFSRWRLPIRGTAGIFMSVALVLFILNLVSGGAFAMASGLAVAAVQTALTIQGAAVIEFNLEKRRMPAAVRRVIIVLCYVILGIPCTILGLVDSLWNLRRLDIPKPDAENGDDDIQRLL
ncbi:hypothetical protein AGMMS49992_33910 [Clostridia bacterium]|nr:hypothetical protein AGMMS49992_33910 [Clostridia bacterium]